MAHMKSKFPPPVRREPVFVIGDFKIYDTQYEFDPEQFKVRVSVRYKLPRAVVLCGADGVSLEPKP